MKIAVIGTGVVGRALEQAWRRSGHDVAFGMRDTTKTVEGARTGPIREVIEAAQIVVLAVPGTAVADVAATHAGGLAGKLVVDATNRAGEEQINGLPELRKHVDGVRYVRAFNTLGWENFADPIHDGVPADLFFTASDADLDTAEQLIRDVGLRPIHVGGDDLVEVVDGLTKLWFALVFGRGRDRRLALRVID